MRALAQLGDRGYAGGLSVDQNGLAQAVVRTQIESLAQLAEEQRQVRRLRGARAARAVWGVWEGRGR
eukprot:5241973-Prymnesium_polylepis.1